MPKTKLDIIEDSDGTPLICSFNDEHSVPFEDTGAGSDEYPEYYCEYKNLGVFYDSEEKTYRCEELTDKKHKGAASGYHPDKSITVTRLTKKN